MHATTILFSLMAVTVSSKSLKYAVPPSLKAAAASNCTMPAEYMIHHFTTYTDKADSTKNTTSFHFVDPGTNVSSHCLSDSSSKPTGPSSNRWPCENPNVEFIYQTTGIVGLTIIEVACPGSKPQFEASDLVDLKLECQDSDAETTCTQTEESVDGEFDSLQPTPQTPPSRRRRTHRMG